MRHQNVLLIFYVGIVMPTITNGLEKYRSRRDFTQTAEPADIKQSKKSKLPIFVIHQHAAKHMHFDLRLESDGVLKSWALPKGPPINATEKHLALPTEDHPLAYADFEGVIPQGNYGAGTVMVWDIGTFRVLNKGKDGRALSVVQSLKSGRLKMELKGKKLCGSYALIKTKSDDKTFWLFIKMKGNTRAGAMKNRDRSALTGRSMKQIAAEEQQGSDDEPPPPEPISPMLPSICTTIPSGDGWIFERKFDGQRCICFKQGPNVTLFSRNKNCLNNAYPELVEAIQKQSTHAFVIDGEIVAFDGNRTRFAKLQERMFITNPEQARKSPISVQYCIFDMIRLNDSDLTQLPLSHRKQLLKKNIEWSAPLVYVSHRNTGGEAYFTHARNSGWEGVVVKKVASTYQQRRSRDWLKLKCLQDQELVIGGYTQPRGKRIGLGALLLGYYDHRATTPLLRYAGKVGTGFTENTLQLLMTQLRSLEHKQSPFADSDVPSRRVHWVRPRLIAQISYKNWTKAGRLRHPRFVGLRNDKEAIDITLEGEAVAMAKNKTNRILHIDKHRIQLSHEEKILYPKSHITKREIIDYYHQIAPPMLPFMKNRPVSMFRVMKSIDEEGFYQKDVSDSYPTWIKKAQVPKLEGGFNHMVVCNNTATLVYLANQCCITPHLWLSRTDNLDRPDRMIFDLDPSHGDDFQQVCRAALMLKKLIENAGLIPFVMTTGSRGLHVIIPLKRRAHFDQIRTFAHQIANQLIALDPSHLTTEIRKEKRQGRIFVDVGRNAYAQTAVAPYALRAKSGAPVATPLDWQELFDKKLTAQRYTIKNIFRRLTSHDDPWRNMAQSARLLPRS